MTIETSREQEKLCLKVKGRLDTMTSPQLDKEVETNLKGTELLTMDLSELDYVSSAGLRVLLSAHKSMKKQGGSMVVRGVNEEVQEVFTITGFSEILTIM
ncbi:MAG: STAS domain-containing protein [Lachnospiraceae bacterium]|jgi:anti-sigma B factor antagonist|nr:STAS domain-containing protein [Lachnospiraceae bacterium]